MRNENSDQMFVEWSKERNDNSWDTRFVADVIGINKLKRGLDVGGGIGTFANSVLNLNKDIEAIDILDPSEQAHKNFISHNKTRLIKGYMSDITCPAPYDFITVNLVCHHIISDTNSDTCVSQINFLKTAHTLLKTNGILLVEENIYDSYFLEDLCGRIIYEITALKGIQKIIRRLGANTAGEGVRFHSDVVWKRIFTKSGFKVINTLDNLGWGSGMPLWQKIPLLCKNRYQRIYVLQKHM